jgi:hypothetical protein
MMRKFLNLPHQCKMVCKETEIKEFLKNVKLNNSYYTRLHFELLNIFKEIKLYDSFSGLPVKGNQFNTLHENLRWERN